MFLVVLEESLVYKNTHIHQWHWNMFHSHKDYQMHIHPDLKCKLSLWELYLWKELNITLPWHYANDSKHGQVISIDVPTHSVPVLSRVYPLGHSHLNEPSVFMQIPFLHTPGFISHSLISNDIKMWWSKQSELSRHYGFNQTLLRLAFTHLAKVLLWRSHIHLDRDLQSQLKWKSIKCEYELSKLFSICNYDQVSEKSYHPRAWDK